VFLLLSLLITLALASRGICPCLWALMRSHSLVADFGAIVHWREPDNPVKDGALSQPFFSLPQALARKSAGGKEKTKKAL
jgi:hypothetical protein